MLDIFFLFGIFIMGFYFLQVVSMIFKFKVPFSASLLFGFACVAVSAKFIFA